MQRFVVEIERPSRCRTWVERFLVELRARDAGAAENCIAFSIAESERVVSCVPARPHLRLVFTRD